MLPNMKNADVVETLQRSGEDWEEVIFSTLDKVQALCGVQVHLDSSELAVPKKLRRHHAQVLDEQVSELRRLLDSYFG